MNSLDNYIRDKLKLKLNLVYSSGKKTNGVISEDVINNLCTGLKLGKYEIVYKGNFPISLSKFDDNYEVKYNSGKYFLTLKNTDFWINTENICLDAHEFIEFSIKEYRNKQLNKILS